jgi:3-deoxy-D-manno-octulosonic-acid transferase
MSYSLGLTLYNLKGRPGPPDAMPPPARPRGRLVWLHAPGEEALAALQELAYHLYEEDGVQTLLTSPLSSVVAAEGVTVQPPPNDYPKDAQAFLDHWRPEMAIFGDGELHPAILHECAQRNLPLLMVGARAPRLPPGREGWFPGLVKSALLEFRHILALDAPAARAFRKAGARPDQIAVTGRMEEASAALPYVESDRAALATLVASRPTWLAADVTPAELPHIIAAHRQVLRIAHRLLLILVPQDDTSAPALAEKLEADENWRVALRRAEQDPDEETEVYLCDASEYGLWYRLAPVTFLGGSLEGSGCARNPMEPAALGSAILCGPRPGAFAQASGRLGAARAARMVASGSDLAEALGDLLAPDRAARQAAAAWEIASEGTEVTEQVIELIRAIMDGSP